MKVVQSVYPEHEWLCWKLDGQIPTGHWRNHDHGKQFFNWLGMQLGYKEMDDWYNVTVDSINHHGKRILSQHYNTSPSQALQTVYPEHDWVMWRFGNTPKDFWENDSHHKQFFDWLGTQLEYKEMDDWYNVTVDSINHHGKGLLTQHYNTSPSQALQTVYPEHDWMMWRFGQTPKGFWENDSHHKQFFDYLGTELGHEMDAWYNVTVDDTPARGVFIR